MKVKFKKYAETMEWGSWLELCRWINAHPQMTRQGTEALQACCLEASGIADACMECDFNQQQ
jgi:hypothetical protein